MTEPTDADRAKAAELFDAKYRRCEEHNRARYWCGCYYADALASERAAAAADLRARVLALAEEMEGDSERAYQRSCGHRDEGSDGQYRAYEDAAARLRAAVTDTTGDPA